MTDKNGFNGVFQEDAKRKRERLKQHVEVTARQYFRMIQEDPKIAQSALSRLWEIIEDAGIVRLSEEEQLISGVDIGYELFRKELFGVDKAIHDAVEHIKVGAQRGSTGKQILVLVGPPAAGKSTFVRILANALENYNKRPIFMIKGCPKQEDPLHLVPRHLKKEAALKPEDCPECSIKPNPNHFHLGIKIEGDLCPVCRDLLLTKYKEDDNVVRWGDVPVETFTFSKQGRRGIGSFEPSDEKSADITVLSGRENIAITSVHGYKHPRAYELSGEIPAGERGFTESREVFSSDHAVLRVFFSVAEEKELKIEGSYFPHISVDTLVIGHTNLTVFKEFNSNKKNEGLHDRFSIVLFRYPLQIKEEIKLYRKLIETESDFINLRKCHIAPGSFELAALFTVMTRGIASQMGIDVLTKTKVYNGDRALNELRDKDKKPIDIRELLTEGQADNDIAKREGMFGLSSRTTLSALNKALARESGANGCLTPLNTLVALRNIFDHRMGITPEEVNRYRDMLSAGEGGSVLAEYKLFVRNSVNKAFLKAYKDLAKELFRQYIEEVELDRATKRKFVQGSATKRDRLTGKPREAKKEILGPIEEEIPLTETEAEVFRGELLEYISSHPDFSYETYPPLAKAVEARLLKANENILELVISPDKPQTEESKKRAQDLFDGLSERGFCKTCAKEMLEEARKFLKE